MDYSEHIRYYSNFNSSYIYAPFFFKKPTKKAWLKQKIIEQERELSSPQPGKKIFLCKKCNYPIALQEDILKVSGTITHSFTNPSGINFNIICFSKALGVLTHGELTREFSWFPDYAWCYSHCINCLLHLGWLFNSSFDKFYCFIRDTLSQSTSYSK